MPFMVRRLVHATGVAILLPAATLAQEPATITGRVTSDAGLPLGQVEVALPTLGLGALSKDDGRYVLVVPGARVSGQVVTLLARRLGYKSQSAQITLSPAAVTHDFVLAANPLQLGEIVVTGAGTATETEKIGNVRNHVDSTSIQKANEVNLVQALAGKAPNVTVIQQSGDPGASSFINIRGASSILGDNQPLFVVDGVPIDNSTFSTSNFNTPDDAGGFINQYGQTDGTVSTNRAADLNPNDIESVEILKGPAAGAIYGSRAAAGVVLITTKSGHPGATHFTLRSTTSTQDLNHRYPLQTSFGQGLFGVHADTSVGGPCSDPALDGTGICRRSWGPAIPPGGTVFDHANELYRTGYTLDNGITISGGNDRTTFYLSGDNTYDQGIVVGPNNHYARSSVRVKATHKILETLKIGANVAFADARGRYDQRGNNQSGLQLGELRTPPDFNNLPYFDPVYGQHRSFRFQHPTAASFGADRGFDNPFFVANEQDNSSKVGRVFGNVSAEYLPTSWLKLNYTLGADYANDERLEGCPVSSAAPCNGGRVIDAKITNYQIDHNLTGTVSYTVTPSFSGRVTVGQNLNTRNIRQLGDVGRGLVAPQPFKLSNTVTRDPPIDAETVIHDASWFGQAEFDLYDQLYLIGALRNDGSSTFGRQNLRSWFPKASAAWQFTKLIGERSWLSYGKARIAYGQAGREPLPYLTSPTFSNLPISGISQGTGFTPTFNGLGGLTSSNVRPASVLKPERSKEFETGVDLGFFHDRADASVTWYNKISADVILLQPIAPATGFSFQAANAAQLRNRGWEVSLNVRPVQTAEYGWDVGLQWARNRSLTLSLGGEQFLTIGDPFVNDVAMVGQPIGVFLGTGFLRCGVSSGSNVVPSDLSGGTSTLAAVCAGKPTGAMYIGPNGFPRKDPDPQIIQDPNYDWTGSVRTGFHYRKVAISGLLDIRHGGQIWNGTKGALWSYGTHQDTEQRATCTSSTSCTGNDKTFGQGGWFEGPVAGPGAGTPVPIGQNWYNGLAACAFPSGVQAACVEDAGFVKLRELSVSYTVDAPWLQRAIGFSSVDLRVAGRNLHTWTNYTGYDPETNLGGAIEGTIGNRGIDYFNNPQTRSFVFSVTLNH